MNRLHVRVEGRGELGCGGAEDVLHAVERCGQELVRVGCRRGGCGVCKVEVLEGSYTFSGPMSRAQVSEEEERHGFALACRLVPTSDLVIRAIHPVPPRARPFSLLFRPPSDPAPAAPT